ncbi:hypothetical protein AC477_00335 [miscellaneous Crenarchaeota group-1 archaeon SG8-32-1]|uniref:Uncharacterized protein n=1 Tax=miscellaneous Crenarchaeota group-1 archaeon SG8-32-1 TaxID=1685124 RepID=A0A0M0C168_9ARCH|nr:MAG: hypothetical protein AC477_00335 [miscellaneous Crenarchaeota group-1 archaeon SG8-32-1]
MTRLTNISSLFFLFVELSRCRKETVHSELSFWIPLPPRDSNGLFPAKKINIMKTKSIINSINKWMGVRTPNQILNIENNIIVL